MCFNPFCLGLARVAATISSMQDADLSAPRPVRLGAIVVVALLHIAAILGLIRAFAPDLAMRAVDAVVTTFTVTVTAPSPSPTPPPKPAGDTDAGAAGTAGKQAVPKAQMATKPKIAIAPPKPAPPVAATGSANSAGAQASGAGTGAGGAGSGTGSGGSGNGQGAGGGSGAVKIAGDINSARDYPIASRELRINDYVLIRIAVGTDGRPTGCSVYRPSRDPAADAITCRLAVERFRFKPATRADGQPRSAIYEWRQRWFY
jgi:protein TonB